jgi:hypothetical protein
MVDHRHLHSLLLPTDGPARAQAIIHMLVGQCGPALLPRRCGPMHAGLVRVGAVTLRIDRRTGRPAAP